MVIIKQYLALDTMWSCLYDKNSACLNFHSVLSFTVKLTSNFQFGIFHLLTLNDESKTIIWGSTKRKKEEFCVFLKDPPNSCRVRRLFSQRCCDTKGNLIRKVRCLVSPNYLCRLRWIIASERSSQWWMTEASNK